MPSRSDSAPLDNVFDRIGRYAADPSLAQKDDMKIVNRYELIIRHEFDGLGLNALQRAFIAQVLTETPPTTDGYILRLQDEIIEATRSPRLRKKWGNASAAFLNKLRGLSVAQKFAIAEGFERGWLGTGDPDDAIPGV